MCAGVNTAIAGNAGAIQALVSALRFHFRNEGVVTTACLALRSVCVNGEPTELTMTVGVTQLVT